MESVSQSEVSLETPLVPRIGSVFETPLATPALTILESLIKKSQETIFESRSIFPLDIVPDHLLIDMTKVTIIYREFFGMGTEHTILLHEIRDVDVEIGLLSARLQILVSGPGVMWTGINNLPKREAVTAKHIIEGLLLAQNQECDFTTMSREERVLKLTSLGKWNHIPKA